MVAPGNQAVIWNMDQAVLMRIDRLLNLYNEAILKKDLEESYWFLRRIRCNITPKLRKEERDELAKTMNELERARMYFFQNKKSNLAWSKFYTACEETEMRLTQLLKDHGVFFREKFDPSKAVLRR